MSRLQQILHFCVISAVARFTIQYTPPVVQEPRQARRAGLGKVLRLLGIAVALFLIIENWNRVTMAGHVLISGNKTAWACAGALQFLCLFLGSCRFWLLLKSLGFRISMPSLYADLVCTTALNSLFLMGLGDLYRLRRTNRTIENLALSSAVIIIDRLLGLATMCGVVLLSSTLLKKSEFAFPITFLLLGLAALIAGLAVARKLARSGRLKIWHDIQRPFIALLKHPGIGVSCLLVSICIFALWFTSIIIVARGLGIQAPLAAIVFAVAVTTLATIVPVSVGGIGVREAGYALLLANYGVHTERAIALGIAQYALFLPIIAVGGVIGLVRYQREA